MSQTPPTERPPSSPPPSEPSSPTVAGEQAGQGEAPTPREIGGREGPEPTRYGDWEKNGRCIDF